MRYVLLAFVVAACGDDEAEPSEVDVAETAADTVVASETGAETTVASETVASETVEAAETVATETVEDTVVEDTAIEDTVSEEDTVADVAPEIEEDIVEPPIEGCGPSCIMMEVGVIQCHWNETDGVFCDGSGTFAFLYATGASYNAGTGMLTFDVPLQNLIPQPFLSARVFFSSPPTVTAGTGVASVVPDGFATFTAAGQPYFQYSAELSQNETSDYKRWTIVFPPTVTAFAWTLGVAAEVPYPQGYVDVLPSTLTLQAGQSETYYAVVRTALGMEGAGVVTWSSDDPNVAAVDAVGGVTAIQHGSTFIRATSGERTGAGAITVP